MNFPFVRGTLKATFGVVSVGFDMGFLSDFVTVTTIANPFLGKHPIVKYLSKRDSRAGEKSLSRVLENTPYILSVRLGEYPTPD